ncbi:MAG: metallopeptidase TldD-related protein [Bryobacteraceae bacterium]|nr:metallopeptidase TldD-related protein [Bryobacteraceae bacterium]
MNRSLVLLIGLSLAAPAFAQNSPDDIVLRSMTDELERSRTLRIPGLEAPYFIEFTLDDAHVFSTAAALGATLSNSDNRLRVPRVKVRVGDAKFDNTNYIYSDFGSGGGESAPVDNDYRVLRRGWWLAADRAYKGAVESIARKRAALKNVTQNENLPDLWPAPPAQQKLPARPAASATNAVWVERIRTLSATFLDYPEVVASTVSFNTTRSTFSMVNTEGTVLQRPEPLTHLQASAAAFAPDGMTVRDSLSLPRTEEKSVPPQEELSKSISQLAENVRALTKASVGENYSGPVLFEGIAGPQVLAELLAPNFALGRRPVGEPGRQIPFLASELENRIESKILPDFLTIIDDPTKKEWNGASLLGSYEIDEEGVVPKPVTLVEKGRLKTFLLTRQPVRGQQGTNGRARLPGGFGAWQASISNLFVNSSESVKAADLRKQFLKLVTDRQKPWGIVVKRMDFPSGASNEEARRLIQAAQQSGAVRPVSAPVLIYKVFPDGREELIRGVRFRGLTIRSLRDIVAVSEEQYPLHYLNNMLPFALMSGGGYVAPASVIGPALLFEDLELERPTDDVPKLPLVPAPELRAATKK